MVRLGPVRIVTSACFVCASAAMACQGSVVRTQPTRDASRDEPSSPAPSDANDPEMTTTQDASEPPEVPDASETPDGGAPEPDAGSVPIDGGATACDARFDVAPRPLREGAVHTVRFTDETAWVHVALHASSGTTSFAGVEGDGPYTWTWTLRAPRAGRLRLTFTAEMGSREIASCELLVEPSMTPDAGTGSDAGVTGPPRNPFGIGLVGPGDVRDLDLAADLVGPGGHVKLIFAGVTRDTETAHPSWVAAIAAAYERDLVPVVRIGPPWGDNDVRNDADDASRRSYRALAAAHVRVVRALPLRAGWPLWIEVHNEPNLCYEWTCRRGEVPGDWIGYEQVAAEYASMLRDVADALHAIGDPRIRVLNGGLAPGGTRRCECGGDGWEGGITSREFIDAMRAAVPDVFSRLDGFATHAYPAEGEGWGFFVPPDRAGPGLRYWDSELVRAGASLPVFVTETGWCLRGADRCPMNGGSRDEIAAWTATTWESYWFTEARLAAVMPFMLRDPGWDAFGWCAPDGSPYPVYSRVRAVRCARIGGRCP
ncbi:MAG: hypothetical protein NZ898_12565 [Myxococcota bacterium]|nr:hypothetical protein [Myxococcota bacterium]MDW8363501.1 hypothetical protein [Myxococcales bacterium]